ncbi:signal recognition particle-docking protein FtsY [Oxalobacteraceae bacterium R-40]|uniref:Signal recognition particle receptor FtsY n=1 Tax=Keguizhuia sedimenti TaxID=3064264 RepID=A0ABU1BJ35_9BURK|nr:signal recognition particle-docking protein FtsY [Oxalobacteraceae bacterium R-40]
MFSFFRRKPKEPAPAPQEPIAPAPEPAPEPIAEPVAEPIASPLPVHDPVPDALIPSQAADDVASETEEVVLVPAETPPEVKKSWMSRLKAGLSKTSTNLTTLFVGAKIDDELYEELESALLMADAGVEATEQLLNSLKRRVKEQKLTEAAQVKSALRSLMIELLTPLQKPLVLGREQPLVMMIAGVNGAGKTTTIGKLANHLQAHRQSVLLAAGDTFRAAAREQLVAWGERNNVTVISQESGDPAAVAFDAVNSAKARKTNVVMVDTAGRLPTQLHLMDELKKIQRVIGKAMPLAPHEILLVIDGNTGQNALAQVKAFDDALGLTGLVITKLDGTAKGGVLAAIAKIRPVPVYFIGIGEKIEDLQPFNAEEFVDALLS